MGDFIDLLVYNAFEIAKEIALDMKEKDWNLEPEMLEDIETAIERYKTNFVNKD